MKRMLTEVAGQLYNKYYQRGRADADHQQASAHWKKFSRNFKVETDSEGQIKEIKGYGFGGSDDSRLLAKCTAAIGNALIISRLSYPGLASAISKAKETVKTMGLFFSQDALRQACTAYFLKEKLTENHASIKNILIIGDGHGILAGLMSKEFPEAKLFLIDLGATLFFQAYYLENGFPEKQHTLLGKQDHSLTGSGFFYCPAEEREYFPKPEFDLAVNIASMQEMTIEIVNDYFQYLREHKTKFFYCCNRLEKTLPDGKLTRFMDYTWTKEDVHLVDEKCPWHQFFFGRSLAQNVKLFNLIPIPMLHRYDGVHWHRLSLLSH